MGDNPMCEVEIASLNKPGDFFKYMLSDQFIFNLG